MQATTLHMLPGIIIHVGYATGSQSVQELVHVSERVRATDTGTGTCTDEIPSQSAMLQLRGIGVVHTTNRGAFGPDFWAYVHHTGRDLESVSKFYDIKFCTLSL